MFSKFCYWLLDHRVKWGDKVEGKFNKWLYNHIKQLSCQTILNRLTSTRADPGRRSTRAALQRVKVLNN